MSLALAKRLWEEGDPQAVHLLLLSPWLDVTMTNPAIEEVDRLDPFLDIWLTILPDSCFTSLTFCLKTGNIAGLLTREIAPDFK